MWNLKQAEWARYPGGDVDSAPAAVMRTTAGIGGERTIVKVGGGKRAKMTVVPVDCEDVHEFDIDSEYYRTQCIDDHQDASIY